MSKTNYAGIDYSGPGATCNRDVETGIRYGIVPAHNLGDGGGFWYDASEPDYGPATCGECGNDAVTFDASKHDAFERPYKHDCEDYACEKCKQVFGSEHAFPEECNGCTLDDGEYKAFSDDSNDVWVTRSPYYTHAQFCSPCAPGACYLASPCDTGAKAYCFGHDWFGGGAAPYPVYSVETGELVQPESKA